MTRFFASGSLLVVMVVLTLTADSQYPSSTWTPVVVKPAHVHVVVKDEFDKPIDGITAWMTSSEEIELDSDGQGDLCSSTSGRCTVGIRGKGVSASTVLQMPDDDNREVVFVIFKCHPAVTPVSGNQDAAPKNP